jgi:ElaB/YqjD/DUF883 family membrane-anchored ribosome-binding protein
MNKERRKQLAPLQDRLIKLKEEAESVLEEMGAIADEESESFEALPEALQTGDRETQQDACETARDHIEEMVNSAGEALAEIINCL